MKYVAILALIIVLLGLPTININHAVQLPDAKSVIDPNSIVTTSTGLFNQHSHTDITMNDEIQSPQSVKGIVRVLRDAESGDTVTFHLVGIGGNLETVVYIINNIKQSKARVTMSVEGNVYSGHAYLAALGGNLKMAPNTHMMFHTFSGYGTNCTVQTGTDRTIPNSLKCQGFIDAIQAEVTSLVESISLLTPEEKQRVLTGYDVFITQSQAAERGIK